MEEVDPHAPGAVAIWVKTPGRSPVKTRLASGIGAADAESFYMLAARAVAQSAEAAAVRTGGRIVPWWAVAEPGPSTWAGFESIWQGQGGLGERLSRVYDALLARHRWVMFLGADSPHLAPEVLLRAADLADRGRFVVGPAADGGFYLFAGSRPIAPERWARVPYSAEDTLKALVRELEPVGPVDPLPASFDVDDPRDLERLERELAGRDDLLPGQRDLADWLARRGEPGKQGMP